MLRPNALKVAAEIILMKDGRLPYFGQQPDCSQLSLQIQLGIAFSQYHRLVAALYLNYYFDSMALLFFIVIRIL